MLSSGGEGVLESVHDWSVALNNKQTTDIVYVDFQKAFDSVAHQKNDKQIGSLRNSRQFVNLFDCLKAFLSNKTQVESISGCMSESETVHITSSVQKGVD